MDVTHDVENDRFQIDHGAERSFVEYRERGEPGRIHFVRTWVDPAHRGKGVGARLVRTALEHARREGLEVTSSCWFVDRFLDRNPEYGALRA